MHGADMIGVPTRAVNGESISIYTGRPSFRCCCTYLIVADFADTHDFEPWAEKNRSQVVWRGTITGVFHRERWDWRSSQRDRLAKLAATGQGMDEDEVEVLVEEGGELERKVYNRGELVDRWMNAGVIDKVRPHITCSGRVKLTMQDIDNMVSWLPLFYFCVDDADVVLTTQCGVGPTGEACRLDGKHEIPCVVDHACEQMRKEIKFKESMTNKDALP